MSEQAQGAQITVGGIDPSDLIHDEAARNAALQEFLKGGTRFGSPDQDSRVGMTTRLPDAEFNAPRQTFTEQVQEAENQFNQLTEQPQVAPSTDELAKWKKLYGDRENEFGTLRRENQELRETMNLLLSQQPTTPQYSQPQPPPFQPWLQPQTPPAPHNPFEGKGADDFISVAEASRAVDELRGMVAVTWQQAQAAQAAAEQIRQANLAAAKQAAGISKLDELRLQAKYPYLAAMPDDPQKFTLMKALIAPPEQPQAQPAPVQAQPVVAGSNVVRRVTHIETNQGSKSDASAGNTTFNSEMAAAQALPFHLRGAAMQVVLDKHGIKPVETMGSGRFRF